MNRRYRKTIIAGNWKMNKTPSETKAFAEQFKAILPKTKWCDIVVCVPTVDLSAAVRAFKDSRIAVGAENVYFEKSGAYTGEISADMLADLGVRYVIVGHSERRALFGETDEIVNKKVLAALEAGLNPIICVGESLAQREMGVTMELIALQVKSALAGVNAEQMRRCVIAYEPIWAIGTGKTATGEQAAEVCTYIRSLIRAQYGARIARSVTIQYGGSMKGSNAHELLSHEDIDGGLIGEFSYENFNAASAVVTIHGVTAHTGYAKGILKNAIQIAMEYQALLPAYETPACTENREGFYHLDKLQGRTETAVMNYLIRDHDEALFRHRQQIMQEAVDFINKKYGAGTAEITITETYRNMYEQVKGHEKLISNVMTAMEHCGITPIVTPIRGGTDGARLSYQGLPCPNICTGGQNGHGRHEFVSIQSMEAITEMLKELVKLFA